MNYPELIQPIDFSALFQLAFTLYAAFIAIEYAKSFTAQVINRFYNFKGEVTSRIEEIKKYCRNLEMVNINEDDYFNSGKGLILKDKYNQKYKECEDKGKEIENKLDNYITKNTEYRIFRHFSLFMMLFCFTLMAAGGVYRIYPSSTIHFLLSFISCGLVSILTGWICSVTHVFRSWSEKKSFITTCSLFVFLIVLSFFSLWIHLRWEDSIKMCLWTVGIVSAVLLPYLNFLFFFFLVTIQMRKIRKYCDQSYKPFIQLCNDTGDLMVKILHYQEMDQMIEIRSGNIDDHQEFECSKKE